MYHTVGFDNSPTYKQGALWDKFGNCWFEVFGQPLWTWSDILDLRTGGREGGGGKVGEGWYLWLLRDIKAGVSGSDTDKPLGWRCGRGGVGWTTHRWNQFSLVQSTQNRHSPSGPHSGCGPLVRSVDSYLDYIFLIRNN